MQFKPLKWQNAFCEFLCTILLQELAFVCFFLSLASYNPLHKSYVTITYFKFYPSRR